MKYIILSIIPVLLFYRSLRFCVIKCFKSLLAQRFASFVNKELRFCVIKCFKSLLAKDLFLCITLLMAKDLPVLPKSYVSPCL